MINHLTRDVLHSVKIDCNTISGQLSIFVVGRDSYIYETGLRNSWDFVDGLLGWAREWR